MLSDFEPGHVLDESFVLHEHLWTAEEPNRELWRAKNEKEGTFPLDAFVHIMLVDPDSGDDVDDPTTGAAWLAWMDELADAPRERHHVQQIVTFPDADIPYVAFLIPSAKSLATLIDEGIEPAQVSAVVATLAGIVNKLHDRGVALGSIDAENVFVDDDGTVTLCCENGIVPDDFEEAATQNGQDLIALMYRMLTKGNFDNIDELQDGIPYSGGQVVPPSQLRSGVDVDMDAIALTGTAIPGARVCYAIAEQLADAAVEPYAGTLRNFEPTESLVSSDGEDAGDADKESAGDDAADDADGADDVAGEDGDLAEDTATEDAAGEDESVTEDAAGEPDTDEDAADEPTDGEADNEAGDDSAGEDSDTAADDTDDGKASDTPDDDDAADSDAEGESTDDDDAGDESADEATSEDADTDDDAAEDDKAETDTDEGGDDSDDATADEGEAQSPTDDDAAEATAAGEETATEDEADASADGDGKDSAADADDQADQANEPTDETDEEKPDAEQSQESADDSDDKSGTDTAEDAKDDTADSDDATPGGDDEDTDSASSSDDTADKDTADDDAAAADTVTDEESDSDDTGEVIDTDITDTPGEGHPEFPGLSKKPLPPEVLEITGQANAAQMVDGAVASASQTEPDAAGIAAAEKPSTATPPLSAKQLKAEEKKRHKTARKQAKKAARDAKKAHRQAKKATRDAKRRPRDADEPHRMDQLLNSKTMDSFFDPPKHYRGQSQMTINSSKTLITGVAIVMAVMLVASLAIIMAPTPTSIRAEKKQAQVAREKQLETNKQENFPKPEVAAVSSLDPEGDNNEHPEMVDEMIDDDPNTFWMSRYYSVPSFGNKSGIGIAITLKEKTKVKAVHVATVCEGGSAQLRATTSNAPKEGKVLASASFGSSTTFTMKEPVNTDSLVIWISELPTDDTGRNRIKVTEISVE